MEEEGFSCFLSCNEQWHCVVFMLNVRVLRSRQNEKLRNHDTIDIHNEFIPRKKKFEVTKDVSIKNFSIDFDFLSFLMFECLSYVFENRNVESSCVCEVQKVVFWCADDELTCECVQMLNVTDLRKMTKFLKFHQPLESLSCHMFYIDCFFFRMVILRQLQQNECRIDVNFPCWHCTIAEVCNCGRTNKMNGKLSFNEKSVSSPEALIKGHFRSFPSFHRSLSLHSKRRKILSKWCKTIWKRPSAVTQCCSWPQNGHHKHTEIHKKSHIHIVCAKHINRQQQINNFVWRWSFVCFLLFFFFRLF